MELWDHYGTMELWDYETIVGYIIERMSVEGEIEEEEIEID
jgi:hypothetical protein